MKQLTPFRRRSHRRPRRPARSADPEVLAELAIIAERRRTLPSP